MTDMEGVVSKIWAYNKNNTPADASRTGRPNHHLTLRSLSPNKSLLLGVPTDTPLCWSVFIPIFLRNIFYCILIYLKLPLPYQSHVDVVYVSDQPLEIVRYLLSEIVHCLRVLTPPITNKDPNFCLLFMHPNVCYSFDMVVPLKLLASYMFCLSDV